MVGKSLYALYLEIASTKTPPQERWRRVDVAANGETVPGCWKFTVSSSRWYERSRYEGCTMAWRGANDDEPENKLFLLLWTPASWPRHRQGAA